ncbi:O-antigen ligase family protein [Bacillus sp. FJAT-42315]|uniref:O-antigen ligase family protein n=1 Tax=Bacillus sp. FJAT-42315 TaxID=2014077 RepID=UPI000C24405E|nr:O-antigen ligase family protein [Bacillus sp. FJAT-42315]
MEINDKDKEIEKATSFISMLLVFILIFYSNESMPYLFYSGPGEIIYYLFCITGVYFLYHMIFQGQRLNVGSTFWVIILIISLFSTMLANQDFSGGFGQIILAIVIGYMFSHILTVTQFVGSYVKVITLLATYSLLVTYTFKPLIFHLPAFIAPVITNEAGISFIDMRFAVVLNQLDYLRNFGIFREPGVYQCFLNFALIFELFFKKTKISVFTVMILCLSIVTTFSTPGYITAMIVLGVYFFETKDRESQIAQANKKKIAWFVSILAASGFIFYFMSDNFSYMFTNTVEKLTEKESSYQGRMVAILANFSFWLEHPIFGGGINAFSIIKSQMEKSFAFSTTHNTSTIGALFSTLGAIFSLIFIMGLYNLFRQSHLSKIGAFMIFLAVMLTINTQLLNYNEILYVLVAFGISKVKL